MSVDKIIKCTTKVEAVFRHFGTEMSFCLIGDGTVVSAGAGMLHPRAVLLKYFHFIQLNTSSGMR